MRATVVFVLLQYVLGLALAIAGVFLFSEFNRFSSGTSILLGFTVSFFCMLTGVGLVGYFHLKVKHAQHKFGQAIVLSLAGILVFLIIYFLIENFLPSGMGILILFIPLTGAVFGFNLVASKTDI